MHLRATVMGLILLACQIRAAEPSANDMPTGKELLAPAPILIHEAPPPPRKLAEVQAILGSALTAAPEAQARVLHIVLCASDKDKAHNKPGYHDYPLWRSRWSRLLVTANHVEVETADVWPLPGQWKSADIIVINSCNPAWALQNDRAKVAALGVDMDAFLARGGGLVFLHWSLNAGPNGKELADRLGLCWGSKAGKYRHGASDWILDKNHPLSVGFTQWHIPDESYWRLTGDLKLAGASVLASSLEEGAPQPQMWTREIGPGRLFVSIPGHFTWTYDDPLYRILIFRGMMWSAHEPIDRLAPLVVVGARVEP